MRAGLACLVVAVTTACAASSTGQAAAPRPSPAATTSPSPIATVTPGVAGSWPDLRPPTAGSCVSTYPADLRRRAIAFDATVTAVRVGDFDENAGMRPATVDLAVHEVFAGPERQTVRMRTWDGFLPRPEPQDAVGLRVLASAGETLDLMACGYTRPYRAAEAAEWRRTFG